MAKAAEELIDFSKGVRNVQEILTGSRNTEFVAVTIPEAMRFAETEDLLAALARLNVTCHHLIVNMVIPAIPCSFCTAKREEQLKVIQEISNRIPEYKVSKMPLLPHKIKSIANLTNLSEIMYGKAKK